MLQNYLNVTIENGKTLLFFDEIQACPRALLSLRYFFEKRPELHLLAAGSLIDFELESISFPVGRIDFYYLYPLNFIEFIIKHIHRLFINSYYPCSEIILFSEVCLRLLKNMLKQETLLNVKLFNLP
ncbi:MULTISPECIES: AAA family ATPase [unclassified Oceanispirochaeta]|nr:AAA family ATPase [Oceanispirochaeta sp. M2]NPD71308.1 AAA family ATPase [Oceanispirochaeta sp. M1]RDG33274.1 hypothetical protein DV872_04265 [Oceanispirochaeta sp. M1]